jgi:hypothetical protein
MTMTTNNEALRIIGDVEIAKLSLAPGDVLVVRVAQHISPDTQRRIKAYIEPMLPHENKVLIIEPGVDLSVVAKI